MILPIQTVNAQKAMVNIGGPSNDEVSSRIIGTLVPGFSNKYNLTMNGRQFLSNTVYWTVR